MTLERIIELGLITDDTEVWLRNSEHHALAHGNWYQDAILDLMGREIERFVWQENNKVYVDVKEESDGRKKD